MSHLTTLHFDSASVRGGLSLVFTLAVALFLGGCQTPEDTADESASAQAAAEQACEGDDCGEGAEDAPAEGERRIITLGGTVTEIVFALNAGDDVVAVDISSTYPEEAVRLPKVGYHRSISAEGILSLSPDLLIGTDELGPPEVVEQLREAGVRILQVSSASTVEATEQRITELGDFLDHKDEAGTLLEQLRSELAEARVDEPDLPRALFVYARGPAQLLVGGKGSQADSLFALAGIPNAAEDIIDFQPLSAEAVVAAAPDVIVMTTSGLESVGGEDVVFTLPGLGATPAASTGALVSIDDQLGLGFGPRLPEAITFIRSAITQVSR